MTRINKIVMTGFKSFGKRTEMLFGEEFNVVLGPNGSGKCLVGDSLVQLADGSFRKIGDLVNNKLDLNKTVQIEDGLIAYGGNTKVLCLDIKTLKIKEKSVLAFVKRKAPDILLKIKTKSGKKITATEYHPLFVLKDNQLRSIKAEELKNEEKIAVPRNLPVESKTKYFVELLNLIKPEDNIYVPYNCLFRDVLKKYKGIHTWEKLSKKIGIPLNSIKGLLDEQSINFAYLVKLLRFSSLDDFSIMKLISKIKAKNSNLQYKMPWKNSRKLARFFGYLLAEGRMPLMTNQIWFTNGEEEIVQDYYNLITSLFGLRATINEYKSGCWDVLAYPEPIRKILNKLGMPFDKTEHKTITNLFLKHSSNEELWQLINGLFSGDGFVSDRCIQLTTKSKKLAFAVETILLRLGISHNSKEIVKIATNSGFSGRYQQISIYSVNNFDRFAKNLHFKHPLKQKRLQDLLNVKSNPNLDLIEINSLVKTVAKDLAINIKKTRGKYPKLDAYCYNQCTPSREGVNQLLDNLFKPLSSRTSQSLVSLTLLDLYANSDIYWDEIVSIEKIKPKEPWVYDLCVAEHHNFIANNFIVHNSNILDAVCFVLGKSSSKSMRAEKSANLIYNGGKTKKPSYQGEVSIYFENSQKTFPTEEDVVKVTRIVRHNGQSIYRINDKTRTRQQILDLMSIAKINPDGYNIILQGDIVRLVEMSPIERRQVVEEIAGISVYEEKKQKTLKELEKVELKLGEADIILKERKTYMRELKKDRDQALKYKDLNDKISVNKASHLKRQIDKREIVKEKYDKQIRGHNSKLEKSKTNIHEIRDDIKANKEKVRVITKDVEEKGDKEQRELQKQVEKLKVEVGTGKNRISSCKNEINRIKVREDQLKKNLVELGEKTKEFDVEKEGLNTEKIKLEKQKQDIEKRIKAFKEEHKLGEEAEKIEKEIEEKDNLIEERQKEVTGLREQQQELLREKDKLDFQIQTIDDRIRKVAEVEKEHETELKQLKQKQEEFKKATLELNKLLNSDSTLAAQLAEQRKKLMHDKTELAKLEAKNISIKESVSGSIAVKSVLKNKSQFGEVYGTVSELGTVESKYSLALEIAAGPRIKGVVVRDDLTAANAIKYLKKRKLGTAHFFPVNKIKSPKHSHQISKILKMPGVHGLASDLIKFDQIFKNVFEYIFGETVVVDDIDNARKIGIGKARMVTLDGDLCDISGVMSGGYRQRKKGIGFKEKELEGSIGRMRAKVDKIESSLGELEKEKDLNEKKINRLRELKATLEGEIIKTEKGLHLDDADLDASISYKEELLKKQKETDKTFDELTEKISELNKGLAEAKIRKQQLKNQINELRNPTLLAELNTFEQKKTELTEELIQINAKFKGIDLQVNEVVGRDSENMNKIILDLKKEKKLFSEEIKALEELIVSQESELKVKEKEQEKFYANFKSLYAKRNKLNDEITEKENLIFKKEEEARQIEYKLNTTSLENAKIKAELAGLEAAFEPYRRVKVDTNKTDEELQKEISEFEKMREKIGSVNMRALDVYTTVEREYKGLLAKRELLEKEKTSVVNLMGEIEEKKKELFVTTFEKINTHFKTCFAQLSTKGEAGLVMEDPEKIFEAGVRIMVKLTGEKFMDIRSLSGGEKTMTALAFLFAIQEHEPAKFYVFDEVDAALDKTNSEKLAKLMRGYCERAQYIVISHNDAIVAEANRLYGVSMNEHGISNVVSLKI